MPRPSTQIAQRQRLLNAAKTVAVREGATGTTLRAIAAEAEMEPSAALYYFPNLNALIRDLQSATASEFISRLEAAMAKPHGSASAKLAALIYTGVTGGLDDDLSIVLYEFWSMSIRDPEMKVVEDSLTEKQESLYLAVIEEGLATGEFRTIIPAQELAHLLLGIEDGLVMTILSRTVDALDTVRQIALIAEAVLNCKLPTEDYLAGEFCPRSSAKI
ncbi:TetR/AcrR family transcriptional regulator [Psychromicrobium sp. YIM B11713]|uniref:TetR/AcrR family transcriptional regulator n=1 Tax=Psychromicrobium sp. YIM B11713 TaxID=3145233 RepID=UPI00374E97A4